MSGTWLYRRSGSPSVEGFGRLIASLSHPPSHLSWALSSGTGNGISGESSPSLSPASSPVCDSEHRRPSRCLAWYAPSCRPGAPGGRGWYWERLLGSGCDRCSSIGGVWHEEWKRRGEGGRGPLAPSERSLVTSQQLAGLGISHFLWGRGFQWAWSAGNQTQSHPRNGFGTKGDKTKTWREI